MGRGRGAALNSSLDSSSSMQAGETMVSSTLGGASCSTSLVSMVRLGSAFLHSAAGGVVVSGRMGEGGDGERMGGFPSVSRVGTRTSLPSLMALEHACCTAGGTAWAVLRRFGKRFPMNHYP